MSFRISAILWIGMPMGDPPFSLLTEGFSSYNVFAHAIENNVDF